MATSDEDGELRWLERRPLRDPVLICAFEGWNDAGDAASSAVEFLARQWDTTPIAEIEAEGFFDFTMVRPVVTLTDEQEREITWPQTVFRAGSVPGVDRDVIVLVGTEPQLRWRTFCRHVLGVAEATGATMVVTLGALLAEVPHSRPTPVYGRADVIDLATSLDLEVSTYEGPTGIVGVLHRACIDAGLPCAALWAAVPSYVSGATSPKAALALIERMRSLLDLDVVTTELEIATAAYERQVDQLVSEDDETAGYVAQLEEAHDADDVGYDASSDAEGDDLESADPDELVAEVEQFLRDQP